MESQKNLQKNMTNGVTNIKVYSELGMQTVMMILMYAKKKKSRSSQP